MHCLDCAGARGVAEPTRCRAHRCERLRWQPGQHSDHDLIGKAREVTRRCAGRHGRCGCGEEPRGCQVVGRGMLVAEDVHSNRAGARTVGPADRAGQAVSRLVVSDVVSELGSVKQLSPCACTPAMAEAAARPRHLGRPSCVLHPALAEGLARDLRPWPLRSITRHAIDRGLESVSRGESDITTALGLYNNSICARRGENRRL